MATPFAGTPAANIRSPPIADVWVGTRYCPGATVTGLFTAFDQAATWYPRSCRHPVIAVLIARSFLARFILAMPQAPPTIAKGSRTMVALAAARPAQPPAVAS